MSWQWQHKISTINWIWNAAFSRLIADYSNPNGCPRDVKNFFKPSTSHKERRTAVTNRIMPVPPPSDKTEFVKMIQSLGHIQFGLACYDCGSSDEKFLQDDFILHNNGMDFPRPVAPGANTEAFEQYSGLGNILTFQTQTVLRIPGIKQGITPAGMVHGGTGSGGFSILEDGEIKPPPRLKKLGDWVLHLPINLVKAIEIVLDRYEHISGSDMLVPRRLKEEPFHIPGFHISDEESDTGKLMKERHNDFEWQISGFMLHKIQKMLPLILIKAWYLASQNKTNPEDEFLAIFNGVFPRDVAFPFAKKLGVQLVVYNFTTNPNHKKTIEIKRNAENGNDELLLPCPGSPSLSDLYQSWSEGQSAPSFFTCCPPY